MRRFTGALLCAFATWLALISPFSAAGATKTWDGSSSAAWATAGNWSGGVAPVNGDGLVFPAGAANLVNTNNSSSVTNFTFLELTGSNYVLRGAFSLSITNGLTNSPGINRSNHLALPLSVRANQTWANDPKAFLTLASNLNINGFTVTAKASGAMDCLGGISGSGATLFKDDTGTLELGVGTSSTVSNLRVRDGLLEVNGTLSGSLSISNGASLTGSGTVPAFDCAGTVTPSLSGPLTVSSGTAVFNTGSLFIANLRGTAVPGTDYAQLKVSSPPNLGGATLIVLTLPFIPSLGDTFVIITNTGAAAFTSTFVGKSEGSTQTVNSVQYRISYAGGSGNDVTLTVVGFTASGTPRTWDGGSVTTSLWDDAANWTNNSAPGVGDDLIFPFSAARTANTNNFATNMTFNTLNIARFGYQLYGAPMRLLGGVVGNFSNGFSTVHAKLVLGQPQTFTIPDGGGLSLHSVDNNGHDLRVTNALGSGTDIDSLVGAGGLTKAGPGILLLIASNSYSGLTVIESGSIDLSVSNGLGAASAATHVLADGKLFVNTGSSTTHAIAEPLELAGVLSIGSGTNVWTGPLTLTDTNARITVPNGSGARLRIAAPIAGPGGFHKDGDGTLELAATNHTFAGATIVEAGTLRAADVQMSGAVSVTNTGAFEASGTVGPLTIAGAFSPRGQLVFATLTVQGPLICQPGAVFSVDYIGSGAGNFDQLIVNGQVTLAGQLLLNNISLLSPGQRLTIIANDGVDPVVGTFAGLPEGAVLIHSNVTFTITYVGGDGNDVQLIAHSAPSQLTSLVTVTNGFKLLAGQGVKNQLYPIEASTNLVNWLPIGIGTASVSGAYSFLDTNADQFPMRFYRAQSP